MAPNSQCPDTNTQNSLKNNSMTCDHCNKEYNMEDVEMTMNKSNFIDEWHCQSCISD